MIKQSKNISNNVLRLVAYLFLVIGAFGATASAIEPVSDVELKKATCKIILEIESLNKKIKRLQIDRKKQVPRKAAFNLSEPKTNQEVTVFGKYIQGFVDKNQETLKRIKEDNV